MKNRPQMTRIVLIDTDLIRVDSSSPRHPCSIGQHETNYGKITFGIDF
jgi:hypothetical protein